MLTALAIGSNLGNRLANIFSAIYYLNQQIIGDIKLSSIYESEALLPENAPSEWNIKFLNMVIIGDSKLEPEILLKEIKLIEQKLGRLAHPKWAPREIDIDIILMGNLQYSSEHLTIPHPEYLNREFVLEPLKELIR
jgi:2-amino-4-hydroxy-6-hydroxymethyldihydropteridine diphosphokinase